MTKLALKAVTGHAAGVPFVALPPAGGARAFAPVVVAWHLLDPPRTESAFAAALPLDGLDAWRVYLGLPLSGSRLPAGGPDELIRRGYEDAVMNIHRPVIYGAAEELGRAYAELRDRFGLEGRVGVMGGSIGAAVAQLVTAERELDVSAAVLVSPVVQLRGAVEAIGRRFGVSYAWSEDSNAVADRLDFIARADKLADAAVMLLVGEDDDPEFQAPAAQLTAKLRRRGGTAQLMTVPGMAHALADEPGTKPAPQTDQAAAVDRAAAEWFQRHLAASG